MSDTPTSDAVPAAGRRCAACSAPLTGKFCSRCGEKAPSPHDLELRGFAHDALHDFFHFDGKLVRSLRALYAKPGLLAQEYFAGRRTRYARPLALFIFLNVAFFLVQPHTQLLGHRLSSYIGTPDAPRPTLQRRLVERRLASTGERLDVYTARFDAVEQGQKKSFLVFIVPVFALCLSVVYARRGRRYAEHLVFAVHYFAVYVTVMLAIAIVFPTVVVPLVERIAGGGPRDSVLWRLVDSELGLIVIILPTLGAWLYLALRRFYGDSPVGALVRMLGLFVVHNLLMHAFRIVLFWTTFAAT